MVRLESAASNRDNNLNLIRILAALAVLISHGWPMRLGPDVEEPLQQLTGESLGRLSVYVFFAISGFLIAASFARSRSIGRFVLARSLRLFPGLLVSLLLVALVMGPLVSTLPVTEYLAHSSTWDFVVQNLTLVRPQYTLPGVFEDNPYPMVEGSIWTLSHEVFWYAMVLVFGLSGILYNRLLMLALLILSVTGWIYVASLPLPLHPKLVQSLTLGLPFLTGMLAWTWREWLSLSFGGVVLLGLAAMAAVVLARGSGLAVPVLILFVTYTTLWLAFVGGGWLRLYNRVGDYSYGVYIYAFPVQGLVTWLVQPQTIALHIALALPLTLLLAILSWHLVEQPALGLMRRGRVANPTPIPPASTRVARPAFADTPWIRWP